MVVWGTLPTWNRSARAGCWEASTRTAETGSGRSMAQRKALPTWRTVGAGRIDKDLYVALFFKLLEQLPNLGQSALPSDTRIMVSMSVRASSPSSAPEIADMVAGRGEQQGGKIHAVALGLFAIKR